MLFALFGSLDQLAECANQQVAEAQFLHAVGTEQVHVRFFYVPQCRNQFFLVLDGKPELPG